MEGLRTYVRRLKGDQDPSRPRKEVPKVAFYVLGAAFTLSAGLTVLIFPYVRQAAKQARLASAAPRLPARSLRPAGGPSATIENTSLREAATSWKGEDFSLSRAPGAPSMGNLLWLGVRALGIATAIVGVGTAIGVVATAKMMDVTNMEEFNAKMRGTLATLTPELAAMSRASLQEGKGQEGKGEPTTLQEVFIDILDHDEPKDTVKPA